MIFVGMACKGLGTFPSIHSIQAYDFPPKTMTHSTQVQNSFPPDSTTCLIQIQSPLLLPNHWLKLVTLVLKATNNFFFFYLVHCLLSTVCFLIDSPKTCTLALCRAYFFYDSSRI